MSKIGILTYHYSNNYGGVLQSYALYSYLTHVKKMKVEIINFIPSNYKNDSILHSTGLRKNVFKSKREDLNPVVLTTRIIAKIFNNKRIVQRFNSFRSEYYKLSNLVNEQTITEILDDYDAIIVGSDQIWTPKQRSRNVYFLGFDDYYNGKKISYAADSTISEVKKEHFDKLQSELSDFDSISVRNEHSYEFVSNILKKECPIVVDPTLLWNFNEFNHDLKSDDDYILVYTLGEEIDGGNKNAIRKIKQKYGDLKVYSIVIPTTKFNLCTYADKVLYDQGPIEWIRMISNAAFVFTDSYHGTLFSIKFKKPFLSYYTEEMRSTRFKDLGKRYDVERYIVSNLSEIDEKESLELSPNFELIHKRISDHKLVSEKYI